MAGVGAPKMGEVQASGKKIAIVAASWHDTVMNGLIEGALRAIAQAQATATVFRVPGTFELPNAAARLADQGGFDAIVALGVVIRGGTPHFDYVCDAATIGLTKVSVETRIPVGFGVLTCDNEEQALARAGLEGSEEDKGFEAAHAAMSMCELTGTSLKKRQLKKMVKSQDFAI